MIKLKTLLLATAVAVLATGGALAQTSTSGQSGQSGMSAPAGTGPTPAQQTKQKDKSPASTDAGAKQEK